MRAGLIRRPRPTVVGRYRVVGELGRGGMGVVYEAVDRRLHRRLAIKLVAIERQRADQRFRMRREAEAMARLSHPNVVQVFDVGRFEDQTFVAMELVEGTTLAGWCRARRRTVDTIVAAFRSAGAGLAAAHDAGVVHRDFKPKNVLVGIDGTVKVTDFGLAQLGVSDGRHGAGTPAYMAPEQRRGVADARSDQYSFCVALHEAVFGVLPGRQQGTLPAARGTVPPELRTTIERGNPEIQIVFDQERAAKLGLAVREIADRVVANVRGDLATRYTWRDKKIDVLVRSIDTRNASIEEIRKLIVNPTSDRPVTLDAVAEVRVAQGPSEIRRIAQERVAVITANLAFGDLGADPVLSIVSKFLQTGWPDDIPQDLLPY
ncbi:MAG: efflux RND transporter permease subunit, partial [Myxococcota bacterium]